jgi:uncharacterized surface protein with fasciclin (FAS1) repeats
VTAADIKTKDAKAQTLVDGSYLRLNRDGSGGVTAKDMQGNVAKVTKADIHIGKSSIHGIDRVLLSRK